MGSTLTWLDTSREEQRRMRELLNLFAETESRDELGIGQVRDAFGDLLFPGTSTLHTRAKYLLLVPWCYREAERKSVGGAFPARVEQNERRLIKTLKDQGETDGLIGRLAGVAVKTLPSAIYWGALGQYGIRTTDRPGGGVAVDHAAETDELADRATGDWVATLPAVPAGFPARLQGGLDLTRSEAAWLRDRMRLGAADTLLAHVLQEDHRPHPDSYAPWEDLSASSAGGDLGRQLLHAELFSLAMHGAALLYNLLIAERYEQQGLTTQDEPVAFYRDALATWAEEVEEDGRWGRLDRADMWSAVIDKNARIASNLRMRAFVDQWLDAVVDGKASTAHEDRSLRALIGDRERSVKHAQSRLVNERLLRTWSGASGSGRLIFRWTQVRRLVLDIHNGLETDDVAS